MKPKVTIEVEQSRDHRCGKYRYRVVKVTNSVDFPIGYWMETSEAKDLMSKKGYTIIVKGQD